MQGSGNTKCGKKGRTSIFGEVPLERRVRVTVRSMSLKGVPLFPFSKYLTRYPLSSAFYTMAQLTCVSRSEYLPPQSPSWHGPSQCHTRKSVVPSDASAAGRA